jgi:glycerophosphoryl diester phosphodiesterase
MEKISWQAHRGGGAHDMPDNTIPSFFYAWKLGAIPEADLRTTADGVIVCFHDNTVERTTDAGTELAGKQIGNFDFEVVRQWDAGSYFSAEYAGVRIPSLEEVFQCMRDDNSRMLYLDLKDVDIAALIRQIQHAGVQRRVIIATSLQDQCEQIKKLDDTVMTMLWIGGSKDEIEERFNEAVSAGFSSLDQVQLHLYSLPEDKRNEKWPFVLSYDLLKRAVAVTKQMNIDLEVFVIEHSDAGVETLLNIGIRWFAVDDAERFYNVIKKYIDI